ncbi:hypothetical protein OROGR_015258 [Orobanche gracilis]
MSNINVKFNLKVITNKQKTKVLYAEANSDFADVLSFLTLPLGTIVRVLKKHNQGIGIGSLTTFRDVIRFLRNLGITDTDETEQMDITFGFKEIMDLLKESFLSRTPLTDIVLNKMNVDYVKSKYEMGTFVPEIVKSQFLVKAVIHGSKNKILFVEADDNFVEFLFSLLIAPLGGIEHLLGGSTTLKNIDNLYRSIQNINADKYLKTQGTKTMLLNPKLPPGYKSANQILPLTEESPRVFYFHKVSPVGYFSYHYTSQSRSQSVSFKFPNGPRKYVTGPTMFIVTDDLIVTPLCATSSLSIFNRLKIPLSDVRELELNVGLEEALSISRASLTSTCALTDGLIKLILNNQPKEEH